MRILGAIVLGIFMLLVVSCGVGVTAYVQNHDLAHRSEETIIAEYDNLQNILASHSQKVAEAAQIPSMQTDDLVKIFTNTLDARYGSDGSQATFQWLKEQNPNLDQTTYIKIQQIIESGRNKFENAQTKFIDTKRVYSTNMGYFWKGFWIGLAGYPKINLDDYEIISSSHARTTFETKTDDGLKLR